MNNRLCILVLSLICSGCTASTVESTGKSTGKSATSRPVPSDVKISQKSSIETLYAANFSDESIEFKVISNGCTKSNHFKLVYNQDKGGFTSVTVVRLKKDLCKKKPTLKRFHIALDKSMIEKNAPLHIANPFGRLAAKL